MYNISEKYREKFRYIDLERSCATALKKEKTDRNIYSLNRADDNFRLIGSMMNEQVTRCLLFQLNTL